MAEVKKINEDHDRMTQEDRACHILNAESFQEEDSAKAIRHSRHMHIHSHSPPTRMDIWECECVQSHSLHHIHTSSCSATFTQTSGYIPCTYIHTNNSTVLASNTALIQHSLPSNINLTVFLISVDCTV